MFKMDKIKFINRFRSSITTITESRYYKTERGYQGQLVSVLNNHMPGLLPNNPIVEQEYQKVSKDHNISIRPDIIIHIPFERETIDDRRCGNYIVIEIKKKSSRKQALEDFANLDLMFERLDYDFGIFLNIDSSENYYQEYTGQYMDRLHCFAVKIENGMVKVVASP